MGKVVLRKKDQQVPPSDCAKASYLLNAAKDPAGFERQSIAAVMESVKACCIFHSITLCNSQQVVGGKRSFVQSAELLTIET